MCKPSLLSPIVSHPHPSPRVPQDELVAVHQELARLEETATTATILATEAQAAVTVTRTELARRDAKIVELTQALSAAHARSAQLDVAEEQLAQVELRLRTERDVSRRHVAWCACARVPCVDDVVHQAFKSWSNIMRVFVRVVHARAHVLIYAQAAAARSPMHCMPGRRRLAHCE